ncbi:MAG: metallopeptidase family protein [Chloroflexi bacterium]|nr:MAG: metallopeptidase family protein [Chloroflexota bacterium]
MRDDAPDDQVAQVERLVGEAIRTLPEPLRGAAEELLIVVDGTRRTGLYGLFDGAPRGAGDAEALPPHITIYARALAEDFPSRTELKSEVRKTLVHEIGHYLGLDESDLVARGLE